MSDQIYEELLKYIARNVEGESAFLTANPMYSVEVIGLLNKIAELKGVPKEENGRRYDQIADLVEDE